LSIVDPHGVPRGVDGLPYTPRTVYCLQIGDSTVPPGSTPGSIVPELVHTPGNHGSGNPVPWFHPGETIDKIWNY